MKVPRDVDASELIKLLAKYEYSVIRQTGSHIRLSKTIEEHEHSITVPNHKPLKIGTFQAIAKDVCTVNNIDLAEFYLQF
jgi:predicted RNA binding protein YcfA (HicA-like mRNA interferase family)